MLTEIHLVILPFLNSNCKAIVLVLMKFLIVDKIDAGQGEGLQKDHNNYF